MVKQHCTICAWRATCNKRFSIADNGSRCPDFSRDVSIKNTDAEQPLSSADKKETHTT